MTPLAATRLDALTSLRFFAAAMIVVLHGASRGIGPVALTQSALAQGVSFFFVLSGFILAWNYPVLAGRQAVQRFYVARVARVWPLHLATLVLIALVATSTWPPKNAAIVTLANVALVQAWVPATSFTAHLNLVSWSLSVELAFYLLFPFFIANWERTRRCKIALAFGVTLLMWTLGTLWAGTDPELEARRRNLVYFHPLGRLFEFALGIYACDLFRRHGESARAWLGENGATLLQLAAVVVAALSVWLSGEINQALAGTGTAIGRTARTVVSSSGFSAFAFAALIWAFALRIGAAARALSTRPMIYLGEISYALYLVHWIVLKYREEHQSFFVDLTGWQVAALYWAVSLALAAALYAAVERPWRAIVRESWEARSITRFSRGIAAVALVAGLAVVAFAVGPGTPLGQYLPARGEPTSLLAQPQQIAHDLRLDRVELLADAHGAPLFRLGWTATGKRPRDARVWVHLEREGHKIRQLENFMEERARIAQPGDSWVSTAPAAYLDFRKVEVVTVALELPQQPSRRLVLTMPQRPE